MLKKLTVVFLCFVVMMTSAFVQALPVSAESVGLDVQTERIRLQTGAQSYEFTKDGSNTWGVDGIYVNGVKTVEIESQTVNLAVGKSCTASSTVQGFTPSAATDPDVNSYWESVGFSPAWISVDLGDVYSVNKVVLKLPSGWESRTQTLSIQTSTDNNTWTENVPGASYTFNPNSSNAVAITFAGAAARYVRVNITANTNAGGGQASQIEIYQDVSANGGFFNGSSRATGYSVLSGSGNTRSIQFTGTGDGTPWAVTYTVNSTDLLPSYHISFSGIASNSVIYRTVTSDPDQSGVWLTRGVMAADAENKDWTYFDGSGPVVFGHSKAGNVDAAYVIMPKLNKHIQSSGKSEQICNTYFKSGRVDTGNGSYYGFWGIMMGAGEPQEYAMVFDRDLGGRVYQVCEKYYASVVDTLGTADSLTVNPIKGDTALTYNPIQLSNPEFYVPGYGWLSYEANEDLGYPQVNANAAGVTAQLGVVLYYEGLATERNWEKNYGAYIMDTMKFRATDPVAYKTVTDVNGRQYSNVPYTNGKFINKGVNGWARFAEWVRPAEGFLGGLIFNNQWITGIASHDDLFVSNSILDYGLISGNQDLTSLGLDTLKYDQNVKFQWDTMDYPAGLSSWNPITDTYLQTDIQRSNATTAELAYWLEVRYQQTGDTDALTKADRIIDWISGSMWDETKMDQFRTGSNQQTFWGSTSIGRFVNALLDKYERSGDIKYKNTALDLAWDGIMLYGITHDFAGVSLAANRYGVDFDCSPNLMFEQDLAIVPMAGKLLDYVSGSSYGKFFTLFHAGPISTFKDDHGTSLDNTVFSTQSYDAQPRALSNLMYALNKSSDDKVITVEKLVSKLDADIDHERDIMVANGTNTDRNTTVSIQYLKAGTYNLIIDGINQGVKTAQQLSEGVALSMPANMVRSVKVTNVSLDPVVALQYTYDASTTYLSSLEDAGATRVLGSSAKYTKDKSWNGNTINLGGTTYSRGIGMCDSTALFYDLNGQYQTFKATVGVDNEVAGASNPVPTISFEVFVDGVLKYDSSTMDKNSARKEISVDVTNAQKLMLRLTNNHDDSGNGNNDHGDWADARLEGKAEQQGTGSTTDDFAGPLASAWTWSAPLQGPTYSFINSNFQLAVPNTNAYDSWSSVDNAPKLTRTDMGSGDWSVETNLNLVSYTPGSNFHSGLAVKLGTNNYLFWGQYQGTVLKLEKSGTHDIINVNYTNPMVYLKITKSGMTYTFYYKANAGEAWTSAGTYTVSDTVQAVGLMTKTWGNVAITTDFGYFTKQ